MSGNAYGASGATPLPIMGDASDNVLTGTSGDDVLLGAAGADTLRGGAGNDVLVGGPGRDKLSGDAGADVFSYSQRADSYRDYAPGGQNHADSITDFEPSVDRIDLAHLGFSGLGNGLNGTLEIVLNADGSKTYIKSREVFGVADRFELSLNGNYAGQLDASHFIFEPGDDDGGGNRAPVLTDPLADLSCDSLALFSYAPGPATFTDPDGDALVYSARLASGGALPGWLQFTPASMSFSGTPPGGAQGSYVIRLQATDPHGLTASDLFVLTVNAVPPSNGDPISGTDGKDTLNGTPGNDLIIGKAGADTLNGGAGDDLLDGGAGRDVLTGGPGADTFRFSDVRDSYRNYNSGGVNAGDIITDFLSGTDKLDLSGLGFSGLGSGYDRSLELIANADGSRTYLKSRNADSSGNRFEIGLNGDQSALAASDIIWGSAAGNDAQVIYLPTLGQSNAKGLRNYGGDSQSGISELIQDLEQYSGLQVYSLFKDGNGNVIDLAIGDSSVTGLSTASAALRAKTWWFTDTDQPGDALLRAVPILQSQLASLRELGEVKVGLIWGQGEGNVEAIALAADKDAAAALYRTYTGKVFDHLQASLGGEATIYLMQTGRFQAQAAVNRGDSPQKIQAFSDGVARVRAAQQQLADIRGDVELAVDYADLPMAYELAPQDFPQDVWHLADESREIVGQRLADFIAEDLGYQGDPSDNFPPPVPLALSGASNLIEPGPAPAVADAGGWLLASLPLLVAASGLGLRRLKRLRHAPAVRAERS